MTAGGARARSGPPPDPEALRRDRPSDQAGWTRLPAAGRDGPVPRWPLPTPTHSGGRRLWRTLWRRPEALMWETNGQEIQVALYVLAVLAAEMPQANASDRKTALSYMDDLGLSNGGRARNRWVIDDAGAARPEPQSSQPASRRSSKDSLLELVVDNE